MTIKKLFGILRLTKNVSTNSWDTLRSIVDGIKSGEIIVKEKSWADNFKKQNENYYPLDLSKLDTWSTYDLCRNMSFYIEQDRLVCEAHIYDGRMSDGSITKLRFSTKLWLPNNFIKSLESKIMYKFDLYADDCYEEFLETKKKNWIDEFKSEIIKNI